MPVPTSPPVADAADPHAEQATQGIMALVEAARKRKQAAKQLLMRTIGDPAEPKHVEWRHAAPNRELWSFITPEVSEHGGWRINTFDANGFIGHASFSSFDQCLDEMVFRGFTEPDPGALDRLSSTQDWAIGTAISDAIQRANQGQISQDQALEEIRQIRSARQEPTHHVGTPQEC